MEIDKSEIEKLIDEKIKNGTKRYGARFKLEIYEILNLEKQLYETKFEKPPNLIPLSQWNKHYSYPTIGTLYQYSFEKENNGFSYCLERGGKNGNRLLINEEKFWKWHRNRFNSSYKERRIEDAN